ncbi:MAG: type III restriction endonuclease subunit R [Acidobacteria bacterium SCN 69-37]|nr:MAG: type III restriction endonuclease subunit R [Acidobacteria bacterium SCN 69-37]
MHRQVNAIAGRLSLRAPQRHSLEILDRIIELATLKKGDDPAVALEAIKAEFPTVTDFEREFPSICFALATGVGKTRLMGAFVTYLHLAHGVRNFFILAPNLTIYSKLSADFTPNTPKYVFKGVAEFAVEPPQIITGDNYDATLLDQLAPCRINIFNISKINSEVRGGKSPRIKRLSEYIGESYFDYLANLTDLVLLMDESHRYRASAGVRAINELKPALGLELTATPFTESSKGPIHFKNVVYRYSLAQAMDDGFVKEPAVVTRKDFNPNGIPPAEIERIKLEDGIRLHENVKVELDTYARESGRPLVKPFVLVIARDTTHAAELGALIKSDAFFDGRYKDRVIQVDSSKTGAEEEAMVGRLLSVEKTDEPTEIVIHVNMLKEGWDVTNLYTIVPLRAANARTLVEQSIGRGLRLPYGERVGLVPVDRLNIVAHDRFQEIVDDANKADSPLRVQAVEIPAEDLQRRLVTVESHSLLAERLGVAPPAAAAPAEGQPAPPPPLFASAEERSVAAAAVQAIETASSSPTDLPGAALLRRPEVQARIAEAVRQSTEQLAFDGMGVDVDRVVATVCAEVANATIDIPRVLVVPIGKVESGFSPFTLDLSSVHYQPVTEDLWIQHLRTSEYQVLSTGEGGIREQRLENYIVRGLVDFDDVSYDEQANLLYDLAGQVVAHLRGYLSEEETGRVLQFHQRALCALIHAQMHGHYWEKAEGGYEAKVYQGFTPIIRRGVFTASGPVSDYRVAPEDLSKIGQMVFGGFAKCLYRVQKFQSDTERRFAVILERDAIRWFKPASGQFQITYRRGPDRPLYVPDFVAETDTELLMIETKARKDVDDPEVAAKRQAAEEWCVHASAHAASYGGRSWRYALVPHDVVAENMSLRGLVEP